MQDDNGAPGESVGAALARLRRGRNLTGARLAAMVGMSQPKISRIERGNGSLDPADVGTLARALGADEETVSALMGQAEQAQNRMIDWRPPTDFPGSQKTVGEWEAAATVLLWFDPSTIPGLLQTSGYARAVLQSFLRITRTADSSESTLLAAVSARIRRQEVLADRSKSFRMVIAESALRSRICPPAEMLAQISHLRDVAGQSNVEITSISDDALIGMPLIHGFGLHDDTTVLIDLYNTTLISRGRRDVEAYRAVFDILEEQATDIEPLLAKYQAIYLDQLRDSA